MSTQPADAGSVDILIAEDDGLVRQFLRRLLEREGYRCSEALDGRMAVEMAFRSPPRCAILDLRMPKLDGLAVARALRADPRTRSVHLHCLTGHHDASLRAEATKAGIEAYLTKPLNPSLLLKILDGNLREPQALQAVGLSLSEARDQLDCWESLGCSDLAAVYKEGEGFSVRGVRPLAIS